MAHELIEAIIASDEKHARWLNTLSYLENCGARKIAACEHPIHVRKEMLQHAYEEFRHAYFLKQQISKLNTPYLETYQSEHLLGGTTSLRYLDKLELQICCLLKHKHRYTNSQIKIEAYAWITYAIEKQAAVLYPIYQAVLKKSGSPVSVRSILLDEERHLTEMEDTLSAFHHHEEIAAEIEEINTALYAQWQARLQAV